MENKKLQLSREELENVNGGRDGQYGYVGEYPCPYCHQVNVVNSYCYSGQTQWTCQNYSCGKVFTINF